MNKKAELTTQQIVVLIVLIASFVIILLLVFRLDLGETTSKEICHNSVILKSKSSGLKGDLDCRTEYVCVSGGGDCTGINPTKTVKIDMNPKLKEGEKKEDKIKEELMEKVADQMAECWWMFGEGGVDYVGLNVESLTAGDMNCALCSRIKFSADISKNLDTIDAASFEEFLKNTENSNGEPYFYYLYKAYDSDKIKLKDISLTKEYYVMTGIGKAGLLKGIGNWFAEGVDDFNRLIGFPKLTTPKFKEHVPIPVILQEKGELDDLKCDNFVTRA